MEKVPARTPKPTTSFLGSVSEFVGVLDHDWNIVFINKTAATALGFQADEAVGKSVWEVFPMANENEFGNVLREAAEKREPKSFNLKTAESKMLEINVFPSADGITVFGKDITECMRVEEALHWSNEKLDLVSHIANQLLMTNDPQTLIQELCGKVMTFLKCDVFFNFILDEQKGKLHLNAYGGITEDMAKSLEWLGWESLCGCAAKEERCIVSENILDTQDERAALARSIGIRVYATQSLFSNGKVFGSLSFGSKQKIAFSEDELELMKTLGAQVSVALGRKKTEEIRKASEENYRHLLQYAPTAIYELDYNTPRFKSVNDAMCVMTGYSREELLVMNPYELLDAESRKRFKERVEKTIKGESIDDAVEFRAVIKGGRKLWILLKVKPLCKDGKLDGALVVGYDITERKKAEEELKESFERERFLAELVRNASVAVAVAYPDGRLGMTNAAFETLTGFTQKELQKISYDVALTPTEYLELTRAKLDEARLKKAPVRYEKEYIRKDGFRVPIELIMNPFFDDRGSIAYYIGFITDITERKSMEEELRRSRDELERRAEERTETIMEQAELLDKATDAIIVRDLENRVTYWSKGAERIYGWTKEEAIGKIAHNLLSSDPVFVNEAIRETISSGQWYGEIAQKTRDGNEIIAESRWTLVSDANQNPKSFLVINTDITERKSLQAQYLRAQRLESIGTLASGIAHDFRNILTPVMVALGLIDQHLTRKEDHEMIAALQKNLQRGADLTNRLLTFTRGVEGERMPLSVLSLIQDVERTIRETFPKSIRVETKIDPDMPMIMGDNTQLHQVLINMCLNARDAMPFGGTLRITADNAFIDQSYARAYSEAKVGPYVIISVIDSGIGMPPEVLEKLFEPFFTTKKPGEGTGLGLSTARSIVKSHGGFISVHSELGNGSTFKIYLPSEVAKNGRMETSEGRGLLQGEGQTILVVDDEQMIRTTTSAVLQGNGYNALEASDGADALAIYMRYRDKIDAILLDMTMPIMNGEATIRALRRIDPHVKIIGMSGLVESGKYDIIYNVTKAFIMKPFTAEMLMKTVAKVVANQDNKKQVVNTHQRPDK